MYERIQKLEQEYESDMASLIQEIQAREQELAEKKTLLERYHGALLALRTLLEDFQQKEEP